MVLYTAEHIAPAIFENVQPCAADSIRLVLV